jgi:glycerophosphoryl diester phosphodiesterase
MQSVWTRVGHRGAPREYPGNTLSGFARAVELGCGMVECDIRQAADGELVLAHDPHVTDIGGTTFVIAEHDSGFLAGLDLGAGEGVPTLRALVAQATGRYAIMADMKCEGGDVEARVVEALASLPPEAKLIPGAGSESRARFHALDPTLPLSLTLSAAEAPLLADGGLEQLLASIDTVAVTWQHPLLDAERVEALHSHGLKVYAWTVDDLPTMRRLLDAGVDGLISNRADLLQTL